jgi:hypothetical protein
MTQEDDAMPITRFDQMLFVLACGHSVVLGRLNEAATRKCEEWGVR